MAIDEGWLTKNGSKWQTIPELMLRYRCASFFGRLYAPELLMGLQTAEEADDFIEAEPDGQGGFAVNLDNLRSQASDEPAPPPVPDADDEAIDVDTSTGEIHDHQEATDPEPAVTATAAKSAAKPQAQQQAQQRASNLDGLNFE
ncbi:hypothetical protein D9M71_737040 [compost metagenome]